MNKKSPLAEMRVVVLRSIEQSKELEESLTSLGADVVLCPMIQFEAIPSSMDKVSSAFLLPFSTLIFTSANGVEFFMKALLENGSDSRVLAGKRLVVVGPQTAKTLKDNALIPDIAAKKFVAEGILELFGGNLKQESILIPTAFGAREVLFEELKRRGAHVVVLKLYKTTRPEIKEVQIKDDDVVLFTSSSTARHFFESPLYRGQDIVSCCIGEVTKATVMEYVTTHRIYVSKEATGQSLIQCLLGIVTK